ncbi:hypothetical protein PIROE2DRAFT_22763, partial [Piromyces sp. E2]
IIPEYPYTYNFYSEYPKEDISLNDFEKFALDRLNLLINIDNKQVGSNIPIYEDRNIRYLLNDSNDVKMVQSNEKKKYNQRRKDYLSHFILRLAYCETEDKREWFIKQECILFYIRLYNTSIDKKEQNSFIESLNSNLKIVSEKEKLSLKNELEEVISAVDNMATMEAVESAFENAKYYKINFEEVPDLVQSRSVLVKKGVAYIPSVKVIPVIVSKYKDHLHESMEKLSSVYNQLLKEDEDRLKPLLTNISNKYIDENYIDGKNGITHQDIPRITRYFPLCMQYIQRSLQMEGHLRHGGRMQYGLFLKGIGVSLEESLKFWRKAFTKITDDQFNKNYAYNIRHNYGREGKRTNYSAYSCAKIIMSNPPSTGDHHGCPFRHMSPVIVNNLLTQAGIDKDRISEVMTYVNLKHYQLACRTMLEIVTNSNEVRNVTHPNVYFD